MTDQQKQQSFRRQIFNAALKTPRGRSMERSYYRARYRMQQAGKAVSRALFGRQFSPSEVQTTPLHTGWDLTPERLRSAYLMAEHGRPWLMCELFDDVAERDLTLGAMADGRRDSLVGKSSVVQPASDDPVDAENAELFREQIWSRIPTKRLIGHQQFGRHFYGWAGTEIQWATDGAIVFVEDLTLARAPWFNISGETLRPDLPPDSLLVRQTDGDAQGLPLLPGKWVVSRRAPHLSLSRAGLMRGCTWWSMLKTQAVADWMLYIKRFGLPFILATLKEFEDARQRAALEAILRRIGDEGAAIVPGHGGYKIEFQDGARSSGTSNSDLHQGIVTEADHQMTKRWYGAVLTSEVGGGSSYAMAREQGGLRFDLLLADAVELEYELEMGLVAPWMIFNSRPGRPPRIRHHLVKVTDPKAAAETAKVLSEMGIVVDTMQLLEHIGFVGEKTEEPQEEPDA